MGVRIPIGTVRIVLAVIAAVIVVVLIFIVGAVAHSNEPIATANPAQMKVQQTAVERDVERAYEQSAQQITKVRALNLAISAAQADQIATKAITDLRTLRHSAFQSLGQITGMAAAEAEAYSTTTETRFDQAPVSRQTASPSPVLLAPRFYAVVSRMSELATLIADQATTQLTAPPPSASPVPSVAPSPTARPSASPSPTRP
ncbi:MAG: hypothetical protein E6I44_03175 [Chloroflexi bacterium]|nr:MAG: hypothetical protein E6I44_03175 [Chloroflexota bacterium]